MRLLKVELQGRYKGLCNQVFDFQNTKGNIIALIGLNGAGKSQLLELVAETFAYLERWNRGDFLTRKFLPFIVIIDYEFQDGARYRVGVGIARGTTFYTLEPNGRAVISKESPRLPDFIIGYASGLNENLQRGFMKNSLQVYDVMSVKSKRWKELGNSSGELEDIAEVNRVFAKKYPHIYPTDNDFLDLEPEDFEDPSEYANWHDAETYQLQNLDETSTPDSQMMFLDYDSGSLIVASLSILPDEIISDLFNDITYCIPKNIKLQFDLRGVESEDTRADIKLFARVAGEDMDDFNELLDIRPYGEICLDLSNQTVKSELSDAHYGNPFDLFKRLYKFLALGAKNWPGKSRQLLRKDDFIGTVKKPLKTKMPVFIDSLELANKEDTKRVQFDDLSDGEAQLMQVMAAARIFSREDTLFLLDEPETHLNPSWRTYFHKHLEFALKNQQDCPNTNTQVLLSTHSPFMISSLYREDVFCFERSETGEIMMTPVSSQTYGTSFDVLIKQHFNIHSLISQTVVKDVKSHLPEDMKDEQQRQNAIDWIEQNMGESMEKAYLLGKLKH